MSQYVGSLRNESSADKPKVPLKAPTQLAEKRKQDHRVAVDSDVEIVTPRAAKRAKQLHPVSHSALPGHNCQTDG